MSLAAGAAGTLAVELSERLERAVLGDEPVYAAKRVARRLFGPRVPGRLLRWTYGPLLGLAAGRALEGRSWPFAAEAAGVGCCVFAFELAAMPAAGATPPVRRWPAGHVAALFVHTLAFGLGFAAARRL